MNNIYKSQAESYKYKIDNIFGKSASEMESKMIRATLRIEKYEQII